MPAASNHRQRSLPPAALRAFTHFIPALLPLLTPCERPPTHGADFGWEFTFLHNAPHLESDAEDYFTTSESAMPIADGHFSFTRQ